MAAPVPSPSLVDTAIPSPPSAGFFYLVTSDNPLGEEGTATVYSKHFEGKKTASGEVYDKKALAAAHPKYAYGTKLRVTNLENGKSAVVTVNDRMKRTAQGVIEVTPRVATSLGFAKAGTARVRVDVVK